MSAQRSEQGGATGGGAGKGVVSPYQAELARRLEQRREELERLRRRDAASPPRPGELRALLAAARRDLEQWSLSLGLCLVGSPLPPARADQLALLERQAALCAQVVEFSLELAGRLGPEYLPGEGP